MRKLVIVLLVILMLLVLATAALPVSAQRGDPGDPPGWSHVSPGQGGSANPGQGGGNSTQPLILR
jgi:hypothetical protein